ncbi:MAG: hypothetical protein MZU91_01020 [Desulfosudis oleivorans]|nr:hypothetical protein [Desulfosudis oleivorans]
MDKSLTWKVGLIIAVIALSILHALPAQGQDQPGARPERRHAPDHGGRDRRGPGHPDRHERRPAARPVQGRQHRVRQDRRARASTRSRSPGRSWTTSARSRISSTTISATGPTPSAATWCRWRCGPTSSSSCATSRSTRPWRPSATASTSSAWPSPPSRRRGWPATRSLIELPGIDNPERRQGPDQEHGHAGIPPGRRRPLPDRGSGAEGIQRPAARRPGDRQDQPAAPGQGLLRAEGRHRRPGQGPEERPPRPGRVRRPGRRLLLQLPGRGPVREVHRGQHRQAALHRPRRPHRERGHHPGRHLRRRHHQGPLHRRRGGRPGAGAALGALPAPLKYIEETDHRPLAGRRFHPQGPDGRHRRPAAGRRCSCWSTTSAAGINSVAGPAAEHADPDGHHGLFPRHPLACPASPASSSPSAWPWTPTCSIFERIREELRRRASRPSRPSTPASRRRSGPSSTPT